MKLVAETVERRACYRFYRGRRCGCPAPTRLSRDAADISLRRRETRRHIRQGLQTDVAARQRFEFARLSVSCLRMLVVSTTGAAPLHRNGFFQRADLHGHVDRCRETGRQVDTFALHGRKTGQRERHRNRCPVSVDDAVAPVAVSRDGPDFLDEGRTCRLHRDARHRQPRRITHAPNTRCLLLPTRGPHSAVHISS